MPASSTRVADYLQIDSTGVVRPNVSRNVEYGTRNRQPRPVNWRLPGPPSKVNSPAILLKNYNNSDLLLAFERVPPLNRITSAGSAL